jgi:uncharacterized phage protein (TIGR01671 family)
MSRIQITVPVQLIKDNDGFWLQVEAKSKRSAMVNVGLMASGQITTDIFNEWAGELFNDALLKRRRDSGVKDKHGVPILEGDILRAFYNESYPVINGAVTYATDLGAFVLSASIGGMPWRSQNLRDAAEWEVIGNVFQNGELLSQAGEGKSA